LPHRRGCFLRGFSSPVVLWIMTHTERDNFAYRVITVFDSTFQLIRLSFSAHVPVPGGTDRHLRNAMCETAPAHHSCPRSNLRPTRCWSSHTWFRLVRFRSPLLTESCWRHVSSRPLRITRDMKPAFSFFSFPLGTEMFHFPRCPLNDLCIQSLAYRVYRYRLPHSEIPGSKVACHLPEAYRRLRRPSSAPSCQAIHRMPLRASAIQNHDPARIMLNGS
jgi:hypothetical protein